MDRPSDPEPSPHTRTDDLARGGDRAAFDQLYRRLAPALHVWASLRIRPSQRPVLAPEDLVQEVWYRALRIFPTFDPERATFRAWIFRVAKNVLLEATRALRRPEVARGPALDGSSVFPLDQIPDDVTAVSRRVARDESIQRVVRMLGGLARPERDLLIHCGLEEMTHATVATMLGISKDAVSKRWQRLRDQLAEAGVASELLAVV